MIKVALVKSNGEVSTVLSTQTDGMYVDGQMYGDLLAKHLALDDDNDVYINTKYWDYTASAWQNREARAGGYMVWINNAWALDATELFTEIRSYRDAYLNASDWTQMPDVNFNVGVKAAWVTYRQALRQVPANNADVRSLEEVSWPTAPGS